MSSFDEAFYLASNWDVAHAVSDGRVASGLQHFILKGANEGRLGDPNGQYIESVYLQQNPDVARAVVEGRFASGYEHYHYWGYAEGRVANLAPAFDVQFYLANNPDVYAAAQESSVSAVTFALHHYQTYGMQEGRAGSILEFNEELYNARYEDVAIAVRIGNVPSGWFHYLHYGKAEGRRGDGADFDEAYYLEHNPDVAAAVNAGLLASGFEHYKNWGIAENRDIHFEGRVGGRYGGAGDDVLGGGWYGMGVYGLAGDDELTGAKHNFLYGGAGADTLKGFDVAFIGGDGPDTSWGGTGFRGTAGTDVFRFEKIGDFDEGLVSGPRETIRNFGSDYTSDKIDLTAIQGTNSGLPLEFIDTNSFSASGIGEVRQELSIDGVMQVQVDVDGDGSIDGLIDVIRSWPTKLERSDFYLSAQDYSREQWEWWLLY